MGVLYQPCSQGFSLRKWKGVHQIKKSKNPWNEVGIVVVIVLLYCIVIYGSHSTLSLVLTQ